MVKSRNGKRQVKQKQGKAKVSKRTPKPAKTKASRKPKQARRERRDEGFDGLSMVAGWAKSAGKGILRRRKRQQRELSGRSLAEVEEYRRSRGELVPDRYAPKRDTAPKETAARRAAYEKTQQEKRSAARASKPRTDIRHGVYPVGQQSRPDSSEYGRSR